MQHIKIKSWNGIGDLLFITPTLKVIKEAYPDCQITVNTNHPDLLLSNPYVDDITVDPSAHVYETDRDGIFPHYPDPKSGILPRKHHILSDWMLICAHYGLQTKAPDLQPEIHFPVPRRGNAIRVQIRQKDSWHGKKSWPYGRELCERYGLEPIPKTMNVWSLVRLVAQSRAVVCIEGGISHIARAVGTPAVVIFGGFAHPRWSGYDDHANIVNEKECSFCYNPLPCVNTQERICMREITPDKVYEALDRLLGENPS